MASVYPGGVGGSQCGVITATIDEGHRSMAFKILSISSLMYNRFRFMDQRRDRKGPIT